MNIKLRKDEQPMKEKIEQALGRKLTRSEQVFVEWMHRWDEETTEAFEALLSNMWKAGQADATAYYEAMQRGSARD